MTQTKIEIDATKPVERSAQIAPPPVILRERMGVKSAKGGKKKRRYTRGLSTIQHLERGMARSLETLAEGVARTFSEYSERSDKSARKKRDGALRDGIKNWTKALSKGMRVAGDAPYDFVKQMNRGPAQRRFAIP